MFFLALDHESISNCNAVSLQYSRFELDKRFDDKIVSIPKPGDFLASINDRGIK